MISNPVWPNLTNHHYYNDTIGVHYDPVTQRNLKGVLGLLLDIFIAMNGALIIFVSIQGMRIWRRMPIEQYAVVPLLIASITVTIG